MSDHLALQLTTLVVFVVVGVFALILAYRLRVSTSAEATVGFMVGIAALCFLLAMPWELWA